MIGVLSWKRFGVLLILLSILAGISSNAPGMAFNKITKSPCNGDGLPCNTENNGNELGDNLTMAGKATIKTSSNSNGGLVMWPKATLLLASNQLRKGRVRMQTQRH